MILRRMSWWERFLLKVSRRRRLEYGARMLEGMRYLMKHPEIRVEIER